MPVANQPLLAYLCQRARIPVEEIGNLGLDGLRQKLPRATAQNFSQRILKCAWLGELNDIILVTAYLPLMESGGSNTPTIRRLTSLRRHQLLAIALAVARIFCPVFTPRPSLNQPFRS
jgi:hypothetical protein